MSKVNLCVYLTFHFKRNITLPLLVSAILIIEVIVPYEYLLLLFLVLTKSSLLQKKINSRNVFYFKYSYSSCYIYYLTISKHIFYFDNDNGFI